MDGRRAAGVVLLSIDLELEIDHYSSRAQSRLDQVRDGLVELFRQHQIPATWAVADPARSAASDPILASGAGHEIAVLGDRTWIGYGAGPLRLERELARRFNGARRVGMKVTTLALRNCPAPADVTPLVAQGITAVRGPAVATAAAARKFLPPVRCGLWEAPTAWLIPPQPTWRLFDRWQMRREMQRTIRERSLLHWEINAQRLADARRGGWQLIEESLAALAGERQRGRIQILTMGAAAAAHLRPRTAVPAHSILRPAA